MLWINKLICELNLKDKNFTDLIFPGTHNSATDEINWKPDTVALESFISPEINKGGRIYRFFTKPFVETQNISIKEQLQKGFRALDLRLVYHETLETEGVWYLHHAYTCYPLERAIIDIIEFMEKTKNTYELLFILFTFMNYDKSIIDILTKINKYVLKEKSKNLEYMKENNERLLVLCRGNLSKPPFSYYISEVNYIGSWIDSDDKNKVTRFLEKELDLHYSRKRSIIQVLYFHLTANKNTVIKDTLLKIFIPCCITGNKRMQNNLNDKMDQLFNNFKIQNVNIICSNYQDEDFILKVIEINKQKLFIPKINFVK